VSVRKRIIAIIIITALAAYAIVSTVVIWRLVGPIESEQPETRQDITELYERIADLEFMLENMDDPEVIRRIAEEILGLVSPAEIPIHDETE